MMGGVDTRTAPRSAAKEMGLWARWLMIALVPVASGCDGSGSSFPGEGGGAGSDSARADEPRHADGGGAVDAPGGSPDEAEARAAGDVSMNGFAGPGLIVDLADDEPLGPFASWTDVKAVFGATGDGVTDDTAALSAALASLCTAGQAPGVNGCHFVLYFPSGTYVISGTLRIRLSYGASLVGEDPASTSLRWKGADGGTMLEMSGSNDTVFTRLTWNGAGKAGIGVAQWWNYARDHNYQGAIKHIDEVFEDLGIGIFGGRMGPDYGQGDSEVTIRRTHFLRASKAGLNLGSFNALDFWVWDSVFTDCARGVTNSFSFGGTPGGADPPSTGAGNFMVYRSLFERSTVADVETGNTAPWFSLYDNVSKGSRQFVHASQIGDNAAALILENNRVLDTVDPTSIQVGNAGPVILVDNQIRSASAGASEPVLLLDDFGSVDRNVFSIGNQFTRPNAVAISSQAGAGDRKVSIDDRTVDPSTISEALPSMQPVPARPGYPVVEVAAGASGDSIQQAIDRAASQDGGRPVIVHLPPGTYTVDHTLTIPARARIQLTGDGMGATVLSWHDTGNPNDVVLRLAGPSYATVRDLTLLGAGVTGVDMPGANQPGGRIFVDGVENYAPKNQPGDGNPSRSPLRVTGLSDTRFEMQTTQFAGLYASGCKSVLSMGGTIGESPIYMDNGSAVLLAGHWYEGATSRLFRGTSGTFTDLGGMVAPYSHGIRLDAGLLPNSPSVLVDGFDGKVTFVGLGFDLGTGTASPANGIMVRNTSPATQALFLGVGANRSGYVTVSGDAGAVGVVMAKGANDGGVSTDLPDLGRNDDAFVRAALAQARSVEWKTDRFVATDGATDVRLVRVTLNTAVFSDTAVGLSIEP